MFDNEDNCLGYLIEPQFDDLRFQLSELSISDYYILVNGVKYFINSDGVCENIPNGVFDESCELAMKHMKYNCDRYKSRKNNGNQ